MPDEISELEEIKMLLRQEPLGLSILEISRRLNIGRNVTAKYLSMLYAAGQVDLRRVAAAKLYTLAHRVPVSALLGLTSDLIVVLDRNLRVVLANDAFQALLRLDRTELVGRQIGAFPPDRLPPPEIGERARVALRGQEVKCEIPWKADGRTVQFHATFVPVVFEDGSPGVTAILEDVTREVEAAQDLEKALEEKEALINAIHHRLRNTLQVVSSILHLQTTCLTDPAARRAIRATELQILSLALAHEDLYRSQYPDRVRMEEYLTRLTGTLLGSYGVPPEKIAWKVRAPGIEMHLELAQFIGFLLTELVVNVIQHAFPDGMTGTMEVTIDRSRAGRYTVTVRDTGVGISEEMHITATAAPGLPTVRLLVEEYLKGHVAVEWSGGTTVTVTFGEEDMLVASPEATESEGQT
ncbi:MAG TPA: histidine kinase dimerization/phosphoacceptor domain -containing protein [Methanoculleus sp.]|jgi:PAS domain S-box-containing protein|uniref:sensor histidine kinase n=1 Tax=Methanoculleus sp. TaxID=90427 RepID=UPI000A96B757|nr:histidine kinase dimerization/phosphoacceptor domain -containing protein [Methanoculleus sp.]MBP7144283.1 PAS domain-containing protein [Methanoculleus sp.]HNT06812.1 histidine kinase dimerization/phosphoacceptor domain -containing protein [Methanoculleus sp.]HNV37649.1 histidine kinase dimerization/phosphoacceptor domain -containing protein [Methanoculleus sp.]HOC83165.1 histidine kinase dimerization/phosphoacceptor domain -containing protein [Methanoculleus sp.]HOF95600.1 histidine kinase